MSRQKIALIVSVIFFVIATIAYLLLGIGRFQLIGTTPENNSSNNDLDIVIGFTFSEDLESSQDISYSARPFIDAETYIEDSSLYLVPNHALLESRSYTVTIESVLSQEDSVIEDIEITFRTAADNSPRALFIRSLPIYQPGFNINYINNTDTFVVQITASPIEQNMQSALEYLEDRDIEEARNNIEFEVLRSLEGSGSPPG